MLDDIRPATPQRRKPKRIEPLDTEPKTPLAELIKQEPVVQEPENHEGPLTGETSVVSGHGPAGPPEKRGKLRFLMPPYSRKQKIMGGLAVILLFFGIGAGWALTHQKPTALANTTHPKTVKKAAPTIYSSLSGLPVADSSVNDRPVTAVMVENSLDARPQSGLSQAGVVFEAVAEGGVTRFMALYQDQEPTNVGPVRSARPYYVQWSLGFDATYAHVGGSPDALANITAWKVKDLNQFYNGNSYRRIASRAAPHNVYTGIDTLDQLAASKGYGASKYTPLSRKADQPYKAPAATTGAKDAKAQVKTAADSRAPASSVDFKLSGYTYDPHFDYDTTTNAYKRSEAGTPQTDANTGAQLSPKTVIAMAVPLSRGALDASGAYYSNYSVIGSGQAWVFQDGTVTLGTWTKPSNEAALTFTGSDGKTMRLNRGQTWISAVTDSSKVTYK